LWLFVFFVPNIAFNLNIYPPFLGHLWSIGIEEQIYAFWPHFVRKTSKLKRNIVLFIILFLFIKLSIKMISIYFDNKIPFSIVSSMSFDCMAIGALFAIVYKEGLIIKRNILIIGQLLFWLFFILSFFTGFSFFSIYGSEVFSILTGFYILGQLTDKNCLISLERPLFNFLGKISFGIYVYHPLIIFLFKYLLIDVFYFKIINTYLLIFIIGFSTIMISFLSYKYIESYFLELRNNRNEIRLKCLK
jgi:peptidoglycan/LPS O-acetylase OafA/YrhL